jgi:DNA repair protein RAD5
MHTASYGRTPSPTPHRCPVCRSGPVTLDSVIRRPPPRPPSPFEIPPDAEIPEVVDLSEPTDPTSSSKVAALIDDLGDMVEGGEEEKAVVFSQFVQFLDLLAQACDEADITWCRLDGKMSQREREVALEKFRSPSGPRVILMSLRTGGVGLNLTVASRVFLMEPWWNWSVEAQAIDRIHRLGQTREVHVTRFIIEDSIEERMLALQGQKESITDVALGGSSTAGTTNRAACEEEKRARRLMELKFLFGNDSS